MILCDANILIQFFKNDSEVVGKLKIIGIDNIAISVITEAELYRGAINKNELSKIRKSLNSLHRFYLTERISKRFISLLSRYTLSHNLDIPDSIIAATAIENNIPLFTLNMKDFKFVQELKFFE